MFYECNSLNSLPDISKWDTSNVKNMSWMFGECLSTINIPPKFDKEEEEEEWEEEEEEELE